jgi:hypothetical protein
MLTLAKAMMLAMMLNFMLTVVVEIWDWKDVYRAVCVVCVWSVG